MKASQWISHKHAFAPGFAQCKLSAIFMLVNIINQSFHYKQKVKVKTESQSNAKRSAFDATYSVRDKER